VNDCRDADQKTRRLYCTTGKIKRETKWCKEKMSESERRADTSNGISRGEKTSYEQKILDPMKKVTLIIFWKKRDFEFITIFVQ
jgi:hypothetical protein